jgi:hypothetical protein
MRGSRNSFPIIDRIRLFFKPGSLFSAKAHFEGGTADDPPSLLRFTRI